MWIVPISNGLKRGGLYAIIFWGYCIPVDQFLKAKK